MKSLSILMNGPSLTKSINSLKKSDTLLCCNHFADTEYYKKLKPQYYLLQDEYFWNNEVRDDYKEKRNKTFELIFSMNHRPVFVIPEKSIKEKLVGVDSRFKNVSFEVIPYKYKILGYNLVSILGYKSILFRSLNKLKLITVAPENAITGGLLWSIYNFNDIRIHGCDLSYFLSLDINRNNNDLIINTEHFYGSKSEVVFSDKYNKNKQQLHDELYKQYKIFKSISILASLAINNDIIIKNVSANSMIQSFEFSL